MSDLEVAIWVSVFGGLFSSLVFFVPLWGPSLVFRKLTPDPPQSTETERLRFGIADGLVLTTFVAFANGFFALLFEGIQIREAEGSQFVAILLLVVFTNLLVALVWIKCQQFMAKHRIVQPRSRLLMQGFLYPLSVVAVGEMLAIVWHPIMYLDGPKPATVSEVFLLHPLAIATATSISLSIAAVFLLRYLFRRFIVLGTVPTDPTADAN